MKRPLYSWIIPIYNEAASLPLLIKEIQMTMRGRQYEIIAVDDGSTDGTRGTIRIPHQGKWAAMRTGIAKTRGDTIITIDSDLQDDPKEVLHLLKIINKGYDVVSGWRKHRQDAWFKRVISNFGNMLMGYRDLNAPMKVYRRDVLMSLPREGSLLRFSLLFANKMGYRTKEVAVVHRKRRYGKSKFGLLKYVRILYDLMLIQLFFTGSNRVGQPADTKGPNRLPS